MQCVSSAMTFCNKALSATYSFKFPLFLLLLQMVTTQALLLAGAWFGALQYPRITLDGLRQHAPVATLYSLNAALAIAALHAVSIPTCVQRPCGRTLHPQTAGRVTAAPTCAQVRRAEASDAALHSRDRVRRALRRPPPPQAPRRARPGGARARRDAARRRSGGSLRRTGAVGGQPRRTRRRRRHRRRSAPFFLLPARLRSRALPRAAARQRWRGAEMRAPARARRLCTTPGRA
jgi:hypothetical protein